MTDHKHILFWWKMLKFLVKTKNFIPKGTSAGCQGIGATYGRQDAASGRLYLGFWKQEDRELRRGRNRKEGIVTSLQRKIRSKEAGERGIRCNTRPTS